MKTVYENPWFRVMLEGTHYWVDEPRAVSSAAVLLILDGREVVLVEALRPLHGGVQLEIPRGYGEAGETSLDCARRELLEETGFALPAEQFHLLGRLQPNSSILSAVIDVYWAEGTAADCVGTHDSEVQDVKRMPIADFRKLVASGGIEDGFTLSALALWLVQNG